MGAARQPRAIKFETICGLNLICSADGSREEALRANQHVCIPERPSWIAQLEGDVANLPQTHLCNSD